MVESLIDNAVQGVSGLANNPIATGIAGAVGGAVVGGLVTAAVIGSGSGSKSGSSRKRNNRIKHTKRGWKQDRARRSKEKWEIAYQKRKKKKGKIGKKGIHYTKKGQPYIILKTGKAKFIKKTKSNRR